MFPTHRLRRMRRSRSIRAMAQESALRPQQLIYPHVVLPGMDRVLPPGPGGLDGSSVDRMHRVAREVEALNLAAIYLVGAAERREADGSEAYSAAGTVQRAIRAIKHILPELTVITDVCLCRYTEEGVCGIVEAGVLHNEATLEALQRIALSHAAAGADFVAPTGMMDGAVTAIRQALDEHGYEEVGIFAGSAIYDSAFGRAVDGGPGGVPTGATRRDAEHRMDPANGAEALREVALDIEEGADVVMVSPATTNLDVIRRIAETFQMPLAAMTGEGEAAALQAAVAQGIVAERRAILESLLVQRRAGAHLLITPFAPQAARWIEKEPEPDVWNAPDGG